MNEFIQEKEGFIRIAGVIKESIVDGPGIRFVIFAQGCPHRCPGCHNSSTHNFERGYDCEIDKIINEIKKNPLLAGVTFSGGEPFCQPKAFLELARKIKNLNLSVIAYSGYTYEELTEKSTGDNDISELMHNIDILIDGHFILEQRDLSLKFRGSQNQRVIDMNKTNKEGHIICLFND